MSYRVLCDENVEPATIGEPEAEGKTATHVNNQPGQESTDEEIVAFARENDYVILTNDSDFLVPDLAGDVCVLYFPDNGASAHGLTQRIVFLQNYYDSQDELPDEIYLTED
jgi:hypothetical protein